MNNDSITTNTSICIILLREIRVMRGIHPAKVANYLGKTSNAWTTVENGKSTIQFETLFPICDFLLVNPSDVMALAKIYNILLSEYGWVIMTSGLDCKDTLLDRAQEYWALTGSSIHPIFSPFFTLSGPFKDQNNQWIGMADVFRFAVDPVFRASQLNNQPQTSQVVS